MLVFDAYPLIALLRAEPVGSSIAPMFGAALARKEAAIAAPNVAELIDFVARAANVEAERVAEAVDLWIDAGLRVEPLDLNRARSAATLRVQYYHRTQCPVSLADCAAVALAIELGASVVTSDEPMAAMAHAEGVDIVGLPDSTGAVAPGGTKTTKPGQ